MQILTNELGTHSDARFEDHGTIWGSLQIGFERNSLYGRFVTIYAYARSQGESNKQMYMNPVSRAAKFPRC